MAKQPKPQQEPKPSFKNRHPTLVSSAQAVKVPFAARPSKPVDETLHHIARAQQEVQPVAKRYARTRWYHRGLSLVSAGAGVFFMYGPAHTDNGIERFADRAEAVVVLAGSTALASNRRKAAAEMATSLLAAKESSSYGPGASINRHRLPAEDFRAGRPGFWAATSQLLAGIGTATATSIVEGQHMIPEGLKAEVLGWAGSIVAVGAAVAHNVVISTTDDGNIKNLRTAVLAFNADGYPGGAGARPTLGAPGSQNPTA